MFFNCEFDWIVDKASSEQDASKEEKEQEGVFSRALQGKGHNMDKLTEEERLFLATTANSTNESSGGGCIVC